MWPRDLRSGAHKASLFFLNGLKWTPGVGVRIFSPVGPIQINVAYNPFNRPPGALYYIPEANASGIRPLYCVSPGNGIPAPIGPGGPVQIANQSCPSTFVPTFTDTFVNHLKLSSSIGPDF